MIISRRGCLAAAAAATLLAACSSTTSGSADPADTAAAAGPSTRPQTSSAQAQPSTMPSNHTNPAGHTNAAFTCTPGFVTTLSGYPVAAQVRHYPVPRLTPSPHGLAGREGLQALRAGQLDVVYNRESTGLPKGPSRAMYDCFVHEVRTHGWTPDRSQNKVYRKDHKPDDPLLFSFYDSGSRFKAGNELTARWFTSKANFGLGALLSIQMEPHQYVPDLRPPPK